LFCLFAAHRRTRNRAFVFLAFAFLLSLFSAVADRTLFLWHVSHEQYLACKVLERLVYLAKLVLLTLGVIELTRSYLATTNDRRNEMPNV
jgi:hypothetical protein